MVKGGWIISHRHDIESNWVGGWGLDVLAGTGVW